jgi:NAD(P)H dehydrogenase (quinone)
MFINPALHKRCMKDILIVYAHPSKSGHNGVVLHSVLTHLDQQKKSYTLIDLYADGFNPCLTVPNADDSLVRSYQSAVSHSTKLIFIYPIWWGGMPAILKGFFDKVFAPKFAYVYKKELSIGPIQFRLPLGVPHGLLSGKKAVALVTSGSPVGVSWLVMGNRFKPAFCSDIMRFCAIRSNVFHTGGCTSHLEQKRKQLDSMAKQALSWICTK